MESDTSFGSTKPFWCRNIFHGNIYLNIYHNPITTAHNGRMTMIHPAEPTPTELELIHSSFTCFTNSTKEFHKSYVKRVPHHQRDCLGQDKSQLQKKIVPTTPT